MPKSIQGMFRFLNLLPRPVADLVAKAQKSDQVLLHSDPKARNAYLLRTGDTASQAAAQSSEPPGPPEPASEPEKQTA